MIKIYHNNRCSKSRACLVLLEAHFENVQIIDYLKNGVSAQEINDLLDILQISPIDLIRKNEAEWKENKDKNLSDEQLVSLMVTYPKLIERPIVIKDGKGIIARPPQKIQDWL